MSHGGGIDQKPPDAPIRGEVRLVTYRRVSHGLYRLKRTDLDADREFVRDLEAILLLAPAGTVFTHVTAARLLGWQLPARPEQVPVFVAVRGQAFHPRRGGLVCSRLTHAANPSTKHGLPIEAPEEILLRAGRDLGGLDLVIMIDAALRSGDLTPAAMETLLASSRPGVRLLREAYALSSAKAESAGESLLRAFHQVMDVPVEPQVELFDDEGRLLGRADLVVEGTRHVHEYDGAHHRS